MSESSELSSFESSENVSESSELSSFESSENVSESSELSSEEHNALRYVAGYIPHNLRKKISNGTHIFKESFLECLSQMGVKGGEENLDTDGSSFQDFTKKWIQKINRGGLFFYQG